MFISNSRPSFHLWGIENLVKNRKVPKYYKTDCRFTVVSYEGIQLNWWYYDTQK